MIENTFTVTFQCGKDGEPPSSVMLYFRRTPPAPKYKETLSLCLLRSELCEAPNHARLVMDLCQIAKITPNQLIIYHDGNGGGGESDIVPCEAWQMCMNTQRLQKALLHVMHNASRLPQTKYGEVKLHWKLSSFQHRPSRPEHPALNLVQIVRRSNGGLAATLNHFHKAIASTGQATARLAPLPEQREQALLQQHTGGRNHWEYTMENLRRLVHEANVHSRDRDEIYFDGRRHPNGCGYNGAIILHRDNTVSIHT
jgi:hypothetical protein